jgi:hypothetical protein
MAYKELHFQSEARERLLRGAKALTDAVSSTRADAENHSRRRFIRPSSDKDAPRSQRSR